MKVYEIWRLTHQDGTTEDTLLPQNHPSHNLLTSGSKKVGVVEAESFDEATKKYQESTP